MQELPADTGGMHAKQTALSRDPDLCSGRIKGCLGIINSKFKMMGTLGGEGGAWRGRLPQGPSTLLVMFYFSCNMINKINHLSLILLFLVPSVCLKYLIILRKGKEQTSGGFQGKERATGVVGLHFSPFLTAL